MPQYSLTFTRLSCRYAQTLRKYLFRHLLVLILSTNVYGGYGYKPTPEQVNRVQTFLHWLPMNTKPSKVVLVPQDKFPQARKDFNVHNDTGIAFSSAGNVYLNEGLFHPSNDLQNTLSGVSQGIPTESAVEWTLAHEAAHANDSTPEWEQEAHDFKYNNAAYQTMQQWNSPQGKAYQNLQNRNFTSRGQQQPISAPLSTALQPNGSSQSPSINLLLGNYR